MCAGANFFFKQLQIKGEWEFLDSINTKGKGSPVLSQEVRELMKSVMRAEKKIIKNGKKPVRQPVNDSPAMAVSSHHLDAKEHAAMLLLCDVPIELDQSG